MKPLQTLCKHCLRGKKRSAITVHHQLETHLYSQIYANVTPNVAFSLANEARLKDRAPLYYLLLLLCLLKHCRSYTKICLKPRNRISRACKGTTQLAKHLEFSLRPVSTRGAPLGDSSYTTLPFFIDRYYFPDVKTFHSDNKLGQILAPMKSKLPKSVQGCPLMNTEDWNGC